MSELLTVGQAAMLAGVSVRTMRRRVAAGEVMTAGHGQARRIVAASVVTALPPGDPATGGQADGTPATLTADVTAAMTEDTPATGAVMAGLVAVVDRLASENRELGRQLVDVSTAATMWQERAGQLADRLDRAESQLLALTAPASPLVASTATGPPDLTLEPFWTRAPRGWIAGAATVLAIVAAVVLLGWPG